MSRYDAYSERELISALTKGDEHAFDFIYWKHLRNLYRYAQSRIRAEEDSKEIVQEVFIDLWRRRETLEVVKSLDQYLFGMVKKKLLEYFRFNEVRNKYAANFAFFDSDYDNSNQEFQDLTDTQTAIEKSIASMPERMQMAFRLSREENLTILLIAQRMNISPRTAETLISNALKRLRESLGGAAALIVWLDSMP